MGGLQKMSLELGRIVKEQWLKVLEANKKYPEYETVKIPLTQFEIDSKSTYLFLKEFSTMLNENPNLFTLIHDGKKILKAYAEEAKKGVYESLVKIELDGWEEATPLHDAELTFHYVKHIAKAKTGISVGLLKMGHIDFFKEFHPVFDEKNSSLESICHIYDCTRKAVDKNLITLYPEPKLFKFLKEIKNVQLKPEVLKKEIEKWVPNKNYGILIKTNEGLIGVIISKHDNNLYVEFPREEIDQFDNSGDLKSLTTLYRKKLGLSLSFGLEGDALKNIVNKILKYSFKDKEVVDEMTDFIKADCGEGVYISIDPVLNFVINKKIRYTPSWFLKKIGHKLQKHIFDASYRGD